MGYRDDLPQLRGVDLVADGGLETTLVFHQGFELPCFAAFDVLRDPAGRIALREYYDAYIEIAREHGLGMILESPTWRANSDWGAEIGYSTSALDEANRAAIALMAEIRDEYSGVVDPIVISACIGPQSDGYAPTGMLSADEAERYHAVQIATFRETAADMLSALTMTYPDEAIGITRAARSAEMPVAISFTVETNGTLPNGQALGDAIDEVDAETDAYPAYFMINCAHPSHFASVLEPGAPWLTRIRGLRANASMRSHAELDDTNVLDIGDPADLGRRHAELKRVMPHLTVLGGCCGTDHRHIAEIWRAWVA